MDQNVCERYRSELLIDKRTKLACNQYRKFFEIIFPLPSMFEQFLLPGTKDKTVELAKKIFSRLEFTLNCPIPNEYSMNLLSIENSTYDIASPHYIAQDHYIHSIYLYITGIYLFFNHSIIHEQIISQFDDCITNSTNPFSSPKDRKILAMINSWKYFSLYHDLGYALEKPLTKNKKINQRSDLNTSFFENYNLIDKHISYELSIKLLSHYLLLCIVLQQSYKKLQDIEKSIPIHKWKRVGNEKEILEKSAVVQLMDEYSEYTCLYNITNYRSFNALLPGYDIDKAVIVVYKSNGEICAIKTSNYTFYHLDSFLGDILDQDKINFIGSYENADTSYYCQYYLRNLQEISEFSLQKTQIWNRKAELDSVLEEIINSNPNLSSFFTKDSNINQLHYEIYTYIRKNISESEVYDSSDDKCLNIVHSNNIKKAIKNTVDLKMSAYIDALFKDKLLTDNEIISEINELKKRIDSISEEEIKEKLKTSHERNMSTINTLWRCTKRLALEYRKMFSIIDIKMIKVIPSDGIIEFFPLSMRQVYRSRKRGINYYKDIIKKNMRFINAEMQELGFITSQQSEDVFLSYQNPNICYDHGIVSATLLGNTLIMYSIISNSPSLDSLIINRNIFNNEIDLVFKTSLFSMLVHNIYGHYYTNSTGNIYLQKLNKNAFSYLGALSDCFQFWNRSRQYNPAEYESPDTYYSGDTDLNIINNIIVLSFKSRNIQSEIQNRKENLSKYLHDANKIIQLKVEESSN